MNIKIGDIIKHKIAGDCIVIRIKGDIIGYEINSGKRDFIEDRNHQVVIFNSEILSFTDERIGSVIEKFGYFYKVTKLEITEIEIRNKNLNKAWVKLNEIEN